jgi:hypothetical protein
MKKGLWGVQVKDVEILREAYKVAPPKYRVLISRRDQSI